jgi:hypothetical protein
MSLCRVSFSALFWERRASGVTSSPNLVAGCSAKSLGPEQKWDPPHDGCDTDDAEYNLAFDHRGSESDHCNEGDQPTNDIPETDGSLERMTVDHGNTPRRRA